MSRPDTLPVLRRVVAGLVGPARSTGEPTTDPCGGLIDQYVHRLDRALAGPARFKDDLLTEARHGLTDAAEGYRRDGVPAVDAARLAVAEFGPVHRLVGAYQAELAISSVRALAVRVILVGIVLSTAGDLAWRGADWAGPAPSAGYRLLSGGIEWLWVGFGLLAVTSYLWLGRWGRGVGSPRISLLRPVGWALSGGLGAGALAGIGLWGWSMVNWPDARSWPPMLVAGFALVMAYGWLVGAARGALAAIR